MKDIQKQEPFKTNQIDQQKPNVARSTNVLTGYFANSMNGGHNKTIYYKQIMAGEKHAAFRFMANIQMLTPLTPAYQNLKMTIRTYFVPNKRVWENAELFTAQRGSYTEDKITIIPNTSGKQLPTVLNEVTDDAITSITNTAIWRDSWISSYIPRMGIETEYEAEATSNAAMPLKYMPRMSILPMRGRIAIYNDMERNKEYEEEVIEYKGDTVTDQEWQSYFPTNTAQFKGFDFYQMRAKRDNSYYTNYRTQYQGIEEDIPEIAEGSIESNNSFITWAAWEAKIAEARAQAENAQKNTWDIISEIRGSKKLTEGKVQLISERTFNLNYSAITQNAYNTNEEIREDFRVMGKQGAYSYTNVDLNLYNGVEFIEEGYIHIIATVTADTVFESGIDRLELNVEALDQYRPDMIQEKFDVLYDIEKSTKLLNNDDTPGEYAKITGFKRKYSEYFKLPNIIRGDMTNDRIYDYATSVTPWNKYDNNKIILTNNTYQFFEQSDKNEPINSGSTSRMPIPKKIWKDYTDIMINKNQAIKNEVSVFNDTYADDTSPVSWLVKGQNQIFFVGACQCLADMPIDEAIKNNYTKWGEH